MSTPPGHFARRDHRRRVAVLATAIVVGAGGTGIGLWISSSSGSNTPAASPTTHASTTIPSSTSASASSSTGATGTTSPSTPSATGTTSPSPGTTTPATTPATTPYPTGPTSTSVTPIVDLVYVVQKGDNLWTIGQWFQMHGYTGLYSENMNAIGANPNLIQIGLVLRVQLSASDALRFKQTLPGFVTSHLTITNVTTSTTATVSPAERWGVRTRTD